MQYFHVAGLKLSVDGADYKYFKKRLQKYAVSPFGKSDVNVDFIYDNNINDDSIKYGRNAVDNHIKHMQAPFTHENFATPPVLDFTPTKEAQDANIKALEKYADANDEYLNSLPPLEYEYRYLPNFTNAKLDKKALLAAAYEEMGCVKEISVKDFEKSYLVEESQTAEPLDINKDGKIDISEYSANILAADVLSKNSTNPLDADGTINSKGFNAILEYSKRSNAEAATKLYTDIYNTYNLGEI